MVIKIFMNEQKISKQKAEKMIGESKLARRLREVKAEYNAKKLHLYQDYNFSDGMSFKVCID